MKAFLVFIAIVAIARFSKSQFEDTNVDDEGTGFGNGFNDQNIINYRYCENIKVMCTSPGIYHYNNGNCHCDCHINPKCPKNQYFNPNMCRCTCFEPSECRECSGNQIWNERTCSCGCRRTLLCPSNKYFNFKSCKCVCRQEPRDCCSGMLPDKVWSDSLCDCTCARERSCKTFYTWHTQLCKCVPIFRTIDYVAEIEKIQNGIEDLEGVNTTFSLRPIKTFPKELFLRSICRHSFYKSPQPEGSARKFVCNFAETLTFTDANTRCASSGMQLFKISSKDDYDSFISHLRQTYSNSASAEFSEHIDGVYSNGLWIDSAFDDASFPLYYRATPIGSSAFQQDNRINIEKQAGSGFNFVVKPASSLNGFWCEFLL